MLQSDKNTKNTINTVIPNNLRPVSYASKTLTSSESNYSDIECELDGCTIQCVTFQTLHIWMQGSCDNRSQTSGISL